MKTLFLILALAGSSFAGERYSGEFKEVRLTDGTVLKDVSVVKVRPDTLSLTHKDGIMKVRKEELPAEFLTKYAAAMEEAAREEAQREREKKERLAAEGLGVKVIVKEGVGFFRYYLKGRDQTGKGCAGMLTVTYATTDRPFGLGKKEAEFKAAPDGDGFATFDWVKGPAGPFHLTGVTEIQWTLTTNDGRGFKGVVNVPWKTEGWLPSEDKLKEVCLTDGSVLEGVCVTKVTATTLDLKHKDGIASVPKEKLPEDLLAKYAAAFEEAGKEAEEWERQRPQREKLRAVSAKYFKTGGGVNLTEALVTELNELLERCPPEPMRPPGGRRIYVRPGYLYNSRIDCQTATSTYPYSVYLQGDGFAERVVPEELKPRVEEFRRKVDQHWSDHKPPAIPNKKKRKKPG